MSIIQSTVYCVECAGEIQLPADVEANEIVVCGDCGVDLEVLTTNPITISLAPMEDEDWGE